MGDPERVPQTPPDPAYCRGERAAANAAEITSRTGTPWARAASAHAANSGLICGGPKGPSLTLPGMAPKGVATVTVRRGRSVRETGVWRTPMEVVSVRSVAATTEARALGARAARVSAGRPFFMVMGMAQAS